MQKEVFRDVNLKEQTINSINYIQNHYWFGMFQQIGLAQNEEHEYILRDALDDFQRCCGESSQKTLLDLIGA